ncbi:hypothetical protein FA15DRAFT_664313 [Coprinopsis marcescibilis]|uniref:Uncharacterized protein n=1 Tax=Coprinopsis marcescibilis TaxID=230819 RepID=A0A5C3L8L6_COPMA|nr:hypothetical protein FA15DRAFT_664313 [Coprinopsis marcescibilis]
MSLAKSKSFIDDSEPERIEIRQRLGVAGPSRPQLSSMHVIEVQDSDSDSSSETIPMRHESPRAHSVWSEKDTPNKPKSLLFTQFAFQGKQPPLQLADSPPRTEDPSGPADTSTSDIAIEQPTRKVRQKRVPFDHVPEVNDREINKLLKCVCCDARWTARKTSLEKRRHIHSCSKKVGYNAETVRVLIEQLVGEPGPMASLRHPASEPRPEPTLFQDFHPNSPTKRRPKPQQSSRLVVVTKSRTDILERAQHILHKEASGRAGISPTSPSATQAFSKSKFGAVAGTRLFDNHGDSETYDNISLSPTQHFAPSKLASHSRTVLDQAFSGLSVADKTVGLVNSPINQGENPRQDSSAKQPTPSKPLKNPRSPRKVKLLDRDWEVSLKTSIVQNHDLYLRILRCEPIKLDVFFALLGWQTPVGIALKTRLMAFFSRQGVTIVDGDATWGRKRKVRSKSRS